MQRVVSLLAGATETVCALGCAERLVGCSHECDYPPEVVARLPVCTTPKFAIEGASYAIDERVRAIVQEGLSVYRVDAERLQALAPDLIVTQTQCAVCAVSPRDLEACLAAWSGGADRAPRLVALAPNTLADVWDDIGRVAAALDQCERGAALCRQLVARIAAIAEQAASAGRPRVACLEWLAPLMGAGNWLPELVAAAGGQHLCGAAGRHTPFLPWETLRAADPDVIVIAPCGFAIARTRAEMTALTSLPGWPRLRAVATGRVYLADGVRYFNRSGPRLVETAEILAEILHPRRFEFGHEGDGWVRWAEPS